MTAGQAGSDLGHWGHGDSSSVECEDCHVDLGSNLSDAAARRVARAHARQLGHVVEISRTLFQHVYPPAPPAPIIGQVGRVEPGSLADRLYRPAVQPDNLERP